MTKKKLFRFKVKEDSDCIYCGEEDSIDHSFISCQFTVSFAQKVLQWFNTTRNSVFNLNTEEFLFGLSTVSDVLQKKLYYIDTDEIPGFFLLLKNHIFIVRSEDTIFIFHL